MSKTREYLIAISIEQGLITLIEPEGEIGVYRQRGIKRFKGAQLDYLISHGFLHPAWEQYKELPKHWSISFEDEEIMGKARATFKDIFK